MPKKLRLLVTASTFPISSEDPCPRFVLDLCRGLEATGRVECLTLAPHSPFADTVGSIEGVRVRRYRYAFPAHLQQISGKGIMASLHAQPWRWSLVPSFFLSQWLAERSAERDFRPAAILAHWLVPQGAIAALARHRRTKLIVVCHGGDVAFLSRTDWRRRIAELLVSRCHRLIAVSEYIRDELIDRFGADPKKIRVIPMGVDLKRFGKISAARKSTPHDGMERIVYVGRLVPGKGLDVLLESLPRLFQNRPLARLEIIGEGPLRRLLEQRINTLGVTQRVIFHGGLPHPELERHLRSASALVVPSVAPEGLGLVIPEAFAVRLPVVAAGSGGIANVISHGHNGLLAQPGSPISLARQMTRMLAEPALRHRIIDAAAQTYKKKFRLESTAKAFLHEIEAVVGS